MLKVNIKPTARAVGSRRIHYAWVIVAVASVMWMTSSSIRFAASMLVPYLQEPDGLGWSYFTISIAFGLSFVGVLFIAVLPTTSHPLIPGWEEALPPQARSLASP